MSYNLVINGSNVVNALKNTYRYDFINGTFEIAEGSEIMITSLQIPYSWFNITARNNNNFFRFYWPTSTVQTITLTNGGSGYVTAPTISFGMPLASIPLTSGGSGYIEAPTVNINGGGATTNAAATAILSAGVVTSIIINNPGIGYTSPPTVTFTPVNGGTGATAGTAVLHSGSGAAATCTIANGAVSTVTITNAGTGYSAIPSVIFNGTNTTPAKAEATIYKKYDITLPDGFYTTTSPNGYLQQFCVSNGLYLIENSTQNYVYYINVLFNPTYYANQIILKTVPTTIPAGFTSPANWAGYPTVSRTPYVEILSTNHFGKFLGFTEGNYGINSAVAYSGNSNQTPVGSTVNSLIIRCSLVNNNVSSQTDVVDAFAINGDFGRNLNFNNNIEKWIKLNAGRYSSFTVSIVDQNMNDIQILDSNILINFIVRTKK